MNPGFASNIFKRYNYLKNQNFDVWSEVSSSSIVVSLTD
jgi:hypothetical protein